MKQEMNVQEFINSGLLQEINRRILHPIGLALYVKLDENGTATLGGIYDNRADPTGIHFAENCEDFSKAKQENVDAMLTTKKASRENILGFFIQPTPKP